jgi:hypothetical protein
VGLQDAFILGLPEPEGFFVYRSVPAQALVSQLKIVPPKRAEPIERSAS